MKLDWKHITIAILSLSVAEKVWALHTEDISGYFSHLSALYNYDLTELISVHFGNSAHWADFNLTKSLPRTSFSGS